LFDNDLTGSSCYFDVPKMLIVPLTKVRFNETQKFILTHLTDNFDIRESPTLPYTSVRL
jgi:hypothetical protein